MNFLLKLYTFQKFRKNVKFNFFFINPSSLLSDETCTNAAHPDPYKLSHRQL